MVKTLAKSIRQYTGKTILTPVVMIGEAAMEILIPYVMSLLMKVLQNGPTVLGQTEEVNWLQNLIASWTQSSVGQVAFYGLIMFIMACLSLACGVIGGKLASEASAGFVANLRNDMYSNIQNFSFANIDKFSTSSLITRLTTDATNVQMCFQMLIRMLIRSPMLFIFAAIMSFNIAPNIATIFIVAAVVMGLAVVFIISRATPFFKKMFEKYDRLNAVAQEDLIGVRVVKSYVREDHEIEKYKTATSDVYYYSIKAEKWLTAMMPVVQGIIYFVMILVLFIGGRDVMIGGLDVGDLSALLTYSTQILSGIMMVAMVLNFFAMTKNSADRIAEVLEEKSTLTDKENPVTEMKDGSIDFENVCFSYHKDGERILDGVSLHISSGETIGVIGATGSAKSTLVSLIPRLYDVNEGSVKVGGVDVRDYEIKFLRDNVSMVLQKNVLFSGSVKENLKWGNEFATDEEIEAAAVSAQAKEFIDTLEEGYDYDLGQGGVNVSGGQKQRLCIARALLKNPKILIFDDSTSAVDTRTDALIRGALKEQAPSVTKIIIAQRIASVEDADRILVLDDGKISAFGTHEELMKTSEIYREVALSQVKGGEENA